MDTTSLNLLNRLPNRLIHRDLCWGIGRFNAFQACGLLGLAAAVMFAFAFTQQRGLSVRVVLLLCAASTLTFLTLAMLTKILAGREVLIYYHHQIAVFATSAAVLQIAGLPILAYLDLVAAGLGIFLAFGRIGCLCAGCCHGRPHRWGVQYGEYHVADGLSPEFAGRRLFPIQAVEAAAVVLLTLGLALTAARPGALFTGYVSGYAALRFIVEFFRGDTDRCYWLTFSEAQWTSSVLAALALADGTKLALLLPAALLATGLVRRRRQRLRDLLEPRHLHQLAEALAGPTRVIRTSLGVQLSVGRTCYADGLVTQYSLSQPRQSLAEREARALCESIASVDLPTPGTQHWVRGGQGVFHLLIHRPWTHDPNRGSQ